MELARTPSVAPQKRHFFFWRQPQKVMVNGFVDHFSASP
jgi:hypothetical protein